jgi:hypothetical protein
MSRPAFCRHHARPYCRDGGRWRQRRPRACRRRVGIAKGTGTDVAIESAGVTLLKGDLWGILRARRLSEATMRNVRENLFFAFIYNASLHLFTMPPESRSRRSTLPGLRHSFVAGHRGGRDDALLGQRDRQCPAAAYGRHRLTRFGLEASPELYLYNDFKNLQDEVGVCRTVFY